MATLGTIGNVLNASVAGRLPYYSFAGGSVWDDAAAAAAIKGDTGEDPIAGDTVTISTGGLATYAVFSETRVFDGAAWVAMSSKISIGATQATYHFPRSAISASRKGYRDWSDIAALAAIRDAGKDLPVDGDCVTLYDDTWTSTRYYKDGKWVEDSIYFPGILSVAMDKPAPSQPGIGDEVKPDLLSKKLRSW